MNRTNPSSRRLRTPERVAFAFLALLGVAVSLPPEPSLAFCGFYVGKADGRLENGGSRVVIARDGERTVLTMANDYRGELSDFAMVVPVPVVLKRSQVHVGDRATLDRLDAFTSPRLAEYFDEDPCAVRVQRRGALRFDGAPMAIGEAESDRARALGVVVEAAYRVGEYDIVVLSGQESAGIETWLREQGYRLPRGASRALAPYVRQGLKFFVAKVNLEEQEKAGFAQLRPLQMAFETPRFGLPIRLGMLNATGEQDLVVHLLTRQGRVETTNYRTVKVPTNAELPPFVAHEFADVYRAIFEQAVRREESAVVMLEHAWDMGWCDPCAANPLTRDELRSAGVFWLDEVASRPGKSGAVPQVLVTRLHLRYDAASFPEDLIFRETKDKSSFQARYVLRHPWTGRATCDAAVEYRRRLRERQEREVQTLARLTGWRVADIRAKADLVDGSSPDAWWRQLWK